MDVFLEELNAGLPNAAQLSRIIIRLIAAALVGGVVGIQRERTGKPAGLRTHMLVAMGTTLFVIVSLEFGMSASDLSRVIQGIAAGIGFIGAGSILKLAEEREITGLTTAASIWLVAAAGVAVGLGYWGASAAAVVLTWIILAFVGQISARMESEETRNGQNGSKKNLNEATMAE